MILVLLVSFFPFLYCPCGLAIVHVYFEGLFLVPVAFGVSFPKFPPLWEKYKYSLEMVDNKFLTGPGVKQVPKIFLILFGPIPQEKVTYANKAMIDWMVWLLEKKSERRKKRSVHTYSQILKILTNIPFIDICQHIMDGISVILFFQDSWDVFVRCLRHSTSQGLHNEYMPLLSLYCVL